MTQRTSKSTHMRDALPSSMRWGEISLGHGENRWVRLATDRLPPDGSPPQSGSWRSLNAHYQAGFTLIEVLIAIAIVGILSTIAVPNVLTEMPKFRLNGAARQVLGDLMTARMKAVSQNKKFKVFFIGGSQYKIYDDANNDGTVDNLECSKPPCPSIDLQSNFPGVTLSSGGNNPTFSPRGTSSNTTITLTSSYGTKTITIAITGRTKIN